MDGLIDMYDETTHGAEMLRQTAEVNADWYQLVLAFLRDLPDDLIVALCEAAQWYLETGEWPEGD